jgi:hypothetical protein
MLVPREQTEKLLNLQSKLQTQSIVDTDLFLEMSFWRNEIDNIIFCLKTNPNFNTLKIGLHTESCRLVLSEIFKLPAISTKIKAVHLWADDIRCKSDIFDPETWQIIFKLLQNIKTHMTKMMLTIDIRHEAKVAPIFNNLRDLIQKKQQLEKLTVKIIQLDSANGDESLSIIELLNAIANSSVKSLRLEFSIKYLNNLSDTNFQSIFEAILSLNNKLTNFSLKGSYEEGGLVELGESFDTFISFLPNLTKLQKFTLQGTDIWRLYEENFKQLLTALSKLIQLKHLAIDNDELEELPGPLLQQFCQMISMLKKIKYLSLDCKEFDSNGAELSPEAVLALTGLPNNLPELYYFHVNWGVGVSFGTLEKYFNNLEYSSVENTGDWWAEGDEEDPDAIQLQDNFYESAAIKTRQRKREIRQYLVEYCILISQILRQNTDFMKLTLDIIHHIIEYIGSDFSKKQATDLFDFVASNGLKWKTTQHKNRSNYTFFQSPVSSSVQDVDVHFYALVRIHSAQDIESLYHFYLKLLDGLSYSILNVKKYLASPDESYQFTDLFSKIAKRALELADAVGHENISQDDAKNFYQPLLALDEIGKRKRPSETSLEIFNGNLLHVDRVGMAKCQKTI